MTKLNRWMLILITLVTLTIISGGVWLYTLNEEIKTKLADKNFLPPTIYYSQPMSFPLTTTLDWPLTLKKLGYEMISETVRLNPGEFMVVPNDQCLTIFENMQDDYHCYRVHVRTYGDPDLQNIGELSFLTDNAGQLLQIYSTANGELREETSLLLGPTLIAQTLMGKPIMQTYKQLGNFPPLCLQAVLAIEDANFLDHQGIKPTSIMRAAINNLLGRAKQGGSTITQQLVKNDFLSNERTIKRKLIEFFMSILLELHSNKDQILETYLNIIYLGQNGPYQLIGFPAASRFYFQKDIQELNLSECSLLAAILNSPGLYDPFKKPDNALKRRGLVLSRMKELGVIDDAEATTAQEQPLPKRQQNEIFETAPYYLDAVQKELRELDIDPTGKSIFTYMNIQTQELAQQSLLQHIASLETDNKTVKKNKTAGNSLEGVVLVTDNETGGIEAVVGGKNFRMTQFNRAVDSHRQVGSVMKPLVFLTALIEQEKDGKTYNALTTLKDEKFTHKYEGQSWSPNNYNKKYFGEVPMYFALINSLNAATSSLGIEVGLDKVVETAHALGVKSELKSFPALTLGAFELYPKEVLQVYSNLARFGKAVEISTVRSVVENNKTLWQVHPEPQQIVPEVPTAELVGMMRNVFDMGTAQAARAYQFTGIAAGKTGTTSDNKDAWFAGFTPKKTGVVWVGYDNNLSHGLTGTSGALPVWARIMKQISNSETDFAWPDDVSVVDSPILMPDKTEKMGVLVFR